MPPRAACGNLRAGLFLYSIGIQYGKEFFTGLIRPYGQKANLLSLFSLMVAGALSLLFIDLFGLKPGYALGIFAGREPAPRPCRPPLLRWATAIPPSVIRQPIPLASQDLSCSCTLPSSSSNPLWNARQVPGWNGGRLPSATGVLRQAARRGAADAASRNEGPRASRRACEQISASGLAS